GGDGLSAPAGAPLDDDGRIRAARPRRDRRRARGREDRAAHRLHLLRPGGLVLGRAFSILRADVPVALVTALGRDGADAYDLVDRLPRGPARAAAWHAYAVQTAADKLVGAGRRAGFVRADTALYAKSVYALVAGWLERAHAGAGGTAGTLTGGLEQVYELGRILALGP